MSVEDSGGASWLGEPVPLPPVGVDVADVRARARRRTRTTRGVLAAGAVAVIVAGVSVVVSRPGGSERAAAPAVTGAAATPPPCPAELRWTASWIARTEAGPGRGDANGPVAVLAAGPGRACRYAGLNDGRPHGSLVASALLSPEEVAGLAPALQTPSPLPSPGSTVIFHCPLDDGSVALLVVPSAAGWQQIRVTLRGCPVMEGPSGRRAWALDVGDKVRAWTHAPGL